MRPCLADGNTRPGGRPEKGSRQPALVWSRPPSPVRQAHLRYLPGGRHRWPRQAAASARRARRSCSRWALTRPTLRPPGAGTPARECHGRQAQTAAPAEATAGADQPAPWRNRAVRGWQEPRRLCTRFRPHPPWPGDQPWPRPH